MTEFICKSGLHKHANKEEMALCNKVIDEYNQGEPCDCGHVHYSFERTIHCVFHRKRKEMLSGKRSRLFILRRNNDFQEEKGSMCSFCGQHNLGVTRPFCFSNEGEIICNECFSVYESMIKQKKKKENGNG